MSHELADLVLDCRDPRELARFWCAALGYTVAGDSGHQVQLAHPTGAAPVIALQRVDELPAYPRGPFLECETGDRDGQVARLVGLGAAPVGEDAFGGVSWVVLADPEGNEFCVASAAVSAR